MVSSWPISSSPSAVARLLTTPTQWKGGLRFLHGTFHVLGFLLPIGVAIALGNTLTWLHLILVACGHHHGRWAAHLPIISGNFKHRAMTGTQHLHVSGVGDMVQQKPSKLPQQWLKALKQVGDIHGHLKTAKPKVVKWMHPPIGRLKLSVDGAFKNVAGSAGGGGILRDHQGTCIFTFATKYQGAISTLDAEARALRDGLTTCCNKGILDIMVETDSTTLMQIVIGQTPPPWELICIIQEMAITTKKLKAQIKHVPQEANQVANSLAGYGCSINQFRFRDSGAALPHVVKGSYRLDKVGCPTLRL
ncbi:hypothetical protein Taro_004782 [Colocasia esculenta]|uniref:RNase H type-1 domain-containing protein n=1 Tax=Colocasia esculenta TaxID=4460 RepID=A0A843TNA3_COLES|nr:hypothetical protein [Colocasia esculenta]